MVHLGASLPADQQQMLKIVMAGYEAAGGAWPVWQYVRIQAMRAGIDATSTWQRLPVWQFHYRPVWTSDAGLMAPADDTSVHLTLAGMAQVDHPAAHRLTSAFLSAVSIAHARADGITPDPRRAVTAELKGNDLVEQVHDRGGVYCTSAQLLDLLRHEPATWGGLSGDASGSWSWQVTDAPLQHFGAVSSAMDYLTRLEGLVGLPAAALSAAPLPALALPLALDHLDLAWRVVFSAGLMRVPRAAAVAKLTLGVASGDEFDSRCSALVEVLKTFRPPNEPQSAKTGLQEVHQTLQRALQIEHGEPSPRATRAIEKLQAVGQLRNGQQHADAGQRAARARARLGLPAAGADPAAEWEHLRVVVVDALHILREEVEGLIAPFM